MVNQVKGQNYLRVKQHFDDMVRHSRVLEIVDFLPIFFLTFNYRKEELSERKITLTIPSVIPHSPWVLPCLVIMVATASREKLRFL